MTGLGTAAAGAGPAPPGPGLAGSAGGAATLRGLHVLVVEDEMLVAMNLERLLEEFGCVVVGPVPSLRMAVEAASSRALDCALLDVNLRGERVFPAAEILVARGIPTLFVTGYGADAIPAHLSGVPVIGKPYETATLRRAMARMLDGGAPAR